MTDALVNNKPEFVRLFTENGLCILDYLNYRKLEFLYSSLPEGTLAYRLLQRMLQRRLQERPFTASSANLLDDTPDSATKMMSGNGPNSISLLEVMTARTGMY